jgi:hypothetical protein
MVRPEESRAAWLQLTRTPTPIYVAETDYGFAIGPRALVRRTAVLAGYFTRAIEYAAFHEAVEAAACEAVMPAQRVRA